MEQSLSRWNCLKRGTRRQVHGIKDCNRYHKTWQQIWPKLGNHWCNQVTGMIGSRSTAAARVISTNNRKTGKKVFWMGRCKSQAWLLLLSHRSFNSSRVPSVHPLQYLYIYIYMNCIYVYVYIYTYIYVCVCACVCLKKCLYMYIFIVCAYYRQHCVCPHICIQVFVVISHPTCFCCTLVCQKLARNLTGKCLLANTFEHCTHLSVFH